MSASIETKQMDVFSFGSSNCSSTPQIYIEEYLSEIDSEEIIETVCASKYTVKSLFEMNAFTHY
jgi:hypothetical protein